MRIEIQGETLVAEAGRANEQRMEARSRYKEAVRSAFQERTVILNRSRDYLDQILFGKARLSGTRTVSPESKTDSGEEFENILL